MTKLAYFEWSAPDDAAPDDPEAWAQANPALGIRIDPSFVTTELGALEAEDFARERLGIFPETKAPPVPVIPPADWQACRSTTSEIVKPVTYAFEVSQDRAWSNIGAAGASSEHGTHVEVGENRPGTGWVVARLLELQQAHAPTAIVCNPHGPAGALLADCEKAGVKVGVPNGRDANGQPKYRNITSADYAQACGAAYDSIVEHRWRHLGQGELDKAVANAEKRQTGSTWVFDQRGDVDISPLVAVTLAAWVASLPIEEPKAPAVHSWPDDDEEFNAILKELQDEEEADARDDLDAP